MVTFHINAYIDQDEETHVEVTCSSHNQESLDIAGSICNVADSTHDSVYDATEFVARCRNLLSTHGIKSRSTQLVERVH